MKVVTPLEKWQNVVRVGFILDNLQLNKFNA